VLKLENVHAYYGSSHILHGVNFNVEAGEIFCLLGRNGVGKTTLLKTLMGLVDRVSGRITLNNRDITQEPTYKRAKAGLAYVPQGREIIPGFTVLENLKIGAYARGDNNQSVEVPEMIWELFPFLREHLNRRGTNLSGGQQQQLAIARALMMEPDVLLLDEPTEGVQPNIVDEIEGIIARLNREFGKTVLLIEQKIEFARTVGSNFVIMEKGAVAAKGGKNELTDSLVNQYMTV
jgi:urea transport system ATP-binding protein